jgi:hypothetical protein
MNPDIWGPHAWFFLYSVALAYPEDPTNEDKQNYFNFYTSLRNILPCLKCRVHFTENLETHPLNENILGSKKSLFEWLHKIQNEVRTSQGKKPYTLTSSYEFFNKAFAKNTIKLKEILDTKVLIAIILVILGIFGLMMYARYSNPKLILA